MRNQEDNEVARVRAEVARALSVHPPDVALLSASLERVDALLAKARAELSAAVREMQLLPEVDGGGGRSEAVAESFPIGWHGSFPW